MCLFATMFCVNQVLRKRCLEGNHAMYLVQSLAHFSGLVRSNGGSQLGDIHTVRGDSTHALNNEWAKSLWRGQVRYKRKISAQSLNIVGHFRRMIENPALVKLKTKEFFLERAIRVMPKASYRDVCNILQVCRKGRFINYKLFESVGARVFKSKTMLPAFSPMQIAMNIQSLGHLWRMEGYTLGFFEGFGKLISAFVREGLLRESMNVRPFNADAIAILVHGLGMVFRHKGEFKRTLELENLLDVCLKKATSNEVVKRLSAYQIGLILDGCAGMQYKNHDAMHKLCGEIEKRLGSGFRNVINEFDGLAIALIISGLGRLNYSHSGALNALGAALIPLLRNFKGREFSKVVKGLALIGYNDHNAWQALSKEIGNRGDLIDFEAWELADVLYGFGRIGFKDEKSWGVLSKEAGHMDRIAQCSSQALSHIVFGFGRLGHNDEAVLDDLSKAISNPIQLAKFWEEDLSDIVHGFALLGYKKPDVLDAVSTEIVSELRLAHFTTHALSDIIYGFAKLGFKSESVLEKLCEETTRAARYGEYTGQDLTKIIYGLGLCQFCNPQCLSVLLERVVELTGTLKEEGSSHIVYGLGLVADQMDHSFLDQSVCAMLTSVVREVGLCVDRYTKEQAVKLCWALGKLHYYDPGLMNGLIGRCAESGLDLNEICMVLDSCGSFNHVHAAGIECGLAMLKDVNAVALQSRQSIIQLIHALTVLDILTPELFEKLIGGVMKCPDHELGIEDHRKLCLSWAALKFKYSEVQLNSEVQKLLDSALTHVKAREAGRDSRICDGVCSILNDIGIDYSVDHEAGDGWLGVKILVKGCANIAIEILNPSDMSINEYNGEKWHLGSVWVRERILKNESLQVLHVPVLVWKSMNGDQQEEWLRTNLGH